MHWAFRVAATSLKIEIRLHTHPVGMNTRSGTKQVLRSSDWLRHSELGYFARSLISALNDTAVTFKKCWLYNFCYNIKREFINASLFNCSTILLKALGGRSIIHSWQSTAVKFYSFFYSNQTRSKWKQWLGHKSCKKCHLQRFIMKLMRSRYFTISWNY